MLRLALVLLLAIGCARPAAPRRAPAPSASVPPAPSASVPPAPSASVPSAASAGVPPAPSAGVPPAESLARWLRPTAPLDRAQIARVLRWVVALRGLHPRRPIALILTRDLRRERRRSSATRMPLFLPTLVAFGLLPREALEPGAEHGRASPPPRAAGATSLPEGPLGALRLGVAFYRRLDDTIVLHETIGAELRSRDPERRTAAEAIVAHELVHALTHQHVGDVEALGRAHLDEAMSRFGIRALSEGDATLVELAYERYARLVEPEALPGRASKVARSLMRRPDPQPHPDPVFDLLDSPYEDGLRFVMALVAHGGFARVDRCYTDLPSSSAQVLHPERYLAREAAAPVLPVEAPPGGGEALRGSAGELLVRTLFRHAQIPEADAVAAGWRGDQFVETHRRSGGPVLVWATTWRDRSSALRAEDALHRVETRAGRRLEDDRSPATSWLVLDDRRVVLVRAPVIDAALRRHARRVAAGRRSFRAPGH